MKLKTNNFFTKDLKQKMRNKKIMIEVEIPTIKRVKL